MIRGPHPHSHHTMYDAIFSAPGKALLAGGYLVLFPEFSAFSVGLSSRMYAAVTKTNSQALVVRSPQFASKWQFPDKSGTHANPFLNACYDTVRAYFGRDFTGEITIFSDTGFHSQQNAQPKHFHNKFSHHNVPITEVPKTGLGSSAALVVAVVSAMCFLCGDDIDPSKIHKLAQIAHSHAQGKIGSGFDVATAVFGTIKYSRFDPSHIPKDESPAEIVKSVNAPWKFTAEQCQLPSLYEVLMGDVAQGSETPGMVKQVLAWRSSHPNEADALFATLNHANMSIIEAMATQDSANIRASVQQIRGCLRQLTDLSGVPIEPPRQTALLDRASRVVGVLGGVVPGAGGDDAICLILDTQAASKPEILAELQKIEGVTWMTGLSLETDGLKKDSI